nr:MAG TPA: hypothetical protein [Caudoviricetes sp.]
MSDQYNIVYQSSFSCVFCLTSKGKFFVSYLFIDSFYFFFSGHVFYKLQIKNLLALDSHRYFQSLLIQILTISNHLQIGSPYS